jgi:hypothetical protein
VRKGSEDAQVFQNFIVYSDINRFIDWYFSDDIFYQFLVGSILPTGGFAHIRQSAWGRLSAQTIDY